MRVRRLRKDAGAPRDHRVHQPDRGAGAVPAVDRGVHAPVGDRPDAAGAVERGVEQLKADNLQLEVVIRPDALEVGDRIGGLIQRIPNAGTGPRHAALSALMVQIKAQVPGQDRRDRAGRAEHLVRHAGAGDGRGARGPARRRAPRSVRAELFPNISIGDAPVVKHGRRDGDHEADPAAEARRAQGRNQTMVDMNLVSLIDVFTILIFFLLSNAGGVETLPSPKAVQLPESMPRRAPQGDRRRGRQRRPRSWSTAARSPRRRGDGDARAT